MTPPPPALLIAATFPIHDWQFWVTTGIALAAALYLASKLPLPWFSARRKKKRMRQKATLTIQGKAVR